MHLRHTSGCVKDTNISVLCVGNVVLILPTWRFTWKYMRNFRHLAEMGIYSGSLWNTFTTFDLNLTSMYLLHVLMLEYMIRLYGYLCTNTYEHTLDVSCYCTKLELRIQCVYKYIISVNKVFTKKYIGFCFISGIPQPCPICRKIMIDPLLLQKHYEDCLKKKYLCPACGMRSQYARAIKKHIEVLHPGESFTVQKLPWWIGINFFLTMALLALRYWNWKLSLKLWIVLWCILVAWNWFIDKLKQAFSVGFW